MIRTTLSALLPALLCAMTLCVPAQETKPNGDSEKAAQARRLLMRSLEEQGIKIDFEKETVTIPVWVNDPPPPDPIEYLLVHRRGKKHEAILVTEVKASLLNGALLLLGFKEGKNATYRERVPPPTREEVEKGAPIADVVAPEGMQVWITAVRETADGKRREDPIEDYLVDLRTERPVESARWVFLGGRMSPLYKNEPPVFVGDFEGNLVSSCYMSPENHIVTIVHERGQDDHNWLPNPAFVPPPDSKLSLVFHRREPAVCAAREKRLQEERRNAGPASRPSSGAAGDARK